MKFLRYRRPSLKTLLGVTKAKKGLKKDLGITAALKPFRWATNQKRKLKRRIGYESDAGRVIRDGLPRPGGCLLVLVGVVIIGLGMAWREAFETLKGLPHGEETMAQAAELAAALLHEL